MQFFQYVLRRNTTTLHLDDDAILLPNFCAAGNRAFKRVVRGKFGFRQLAFASPALWVRRGFDSLYFGHCYEFYGHRVDSVGLNVKGKCHRIAGREFLSIASSPFCEHAYALSPQGAAKLLAALSSWNVTYTAFHRQRVTQHGWMWHDQPGRGESHRAHRRHLQTRPLTCDPDPHSGPDPGGAKGVDFAIVKQIRRYNKFDAYDMWPQVVLQGWQRDVLRNRTNTKDLLQHLQANPRNWQVHDTRSAKKCKQMERGDCMARARLVRAADLLTPMGCFCYEGHLGRWKTRKDFRHLVNCSVTPRSAEQPDTYIADIGLHTTESVAELEEQLQQKASSNQGSSKDESKDEIDTMSLEEVRALAKRQRRELASKE